MHLRFSAWEFECSQAPALPQMRGLPLCLMHYWGPYLWGQLVLSGSDRWGRGDFTRASQTRTQSHRAGRWHSCNANLGLSNFCFQLKGVRKPASTSKGLAEIKFPLTTVWPKRLVLEYNLEGSIFFSVILFLEWIDILYLIYFFVLK